MNVAALVPCGDAARDMLSQKCKSLIASGNHHECNSGSRAAASGETTSGAIVCVSTDQFGADQTRANSKLTAQSIINMVLLVMPFAEQVNK